MNARMIGAALAAVALSSGCWRTSKVVVPVPAGRAYIHGASGTLLGSLDFTPTTTGVHITGALNGLPAGRHGIHFHAIGTCTTPDFTSAGPHFNPANMHHGLENPEGPHAGDLPNILVDSKGHVDVDLTNPRVTLDFSPNTWLFDGDGTAIVIHAGADDQRTDPSGSSGARIACGVLEKTQ